MNKYITSKQVAVLAGTTKNRVKSEPFRFPGAVRDKRNRLRFEKQEIVEAFFRGDLENTNRAYPVKVVESFESGSISESVPGSDLDIDI